MFRTQPSGTPVPSVQSNVSFLSSLAEQEKPKTTIKTTKKHQKPWFLHVFVNVFTINFGLHAEQIYHLHRLEESRANKRYLDRLQRWDLVCSSSDLMV